MRWGSLHHRELAVAAAGAGAEVAAAVATAGLAPLALPPADTPRASCPPTRYPSCWIRSRTFPCRSRSRLWARCRHPHPRHHCCRFRPPWWSPSQSWGGGRAAAGHCSTASLILASNSHSSSEALAGSCAGVGVAAVGAGPGQDLAVIRRRRVPGRTTVGRAKTRRTRPAWPPRKSSRMGRRTRGPSRGAAGRSFTPLGGRVAASGGLALFHCGFFTFTLVFRLNGAICCLSSVFYHILMHFLIHV